MKYHVLNKLYFEHSCSNSDRSVVQELTASTRPFRNTAHIEKGEGEAGYVMCTVLCGKGFQMLYCVHSTERAILGHVFEFLLAEKFMFYTKILHITENVKIRKIQQPEWRKTTVKLQIQILTKQMVAHLSCLFIYSIHFTFM